MSQSRSLSPGTAHLLKSGKALRHALRENIGIIWHQVQLMQMSNNEKKIAKKVSFYPRWGRKVNSQVILNAT